jgi:hypothetical protein
MRNTITTIGLLTGMLMLVWGCGAFWHDAQLPVQNLLSLDFMNDKLGTEVVSLSNQGQCPGTRPFRVVNVETDTDKHIFLRVVGHKHYLIPKTFCDLVKSHLEVKLVESGLTLDETDGSVIQVSFEAAEVVGSMVPEATATLRFEIPEIGYSQTFTAVEGSANGLNALAYTVHLAIDQFVKDPAFTAFATCH